MVMVFSSGLRSRPRVLRREVTWPVANQVTGRMRKGQKFAAKRGTGSFLSATIVKQLMSNHLFT
jgi:hypothetical protein